eukprot:scaffold28966_cov90-Isochrysis_galbana.AAC.1
MSGSAVRGRHQWIAQVGRTRRRLSAAVWVGSQGGEEVLRRDSPHLCLPSSCAGAERLSDGIQTEPARARIEHGITGRLGGATAGGAGAELSCRRARRVASVRSARRRRDRVARPHGRLDEEGCELPHLYPCVAHRHQRAAGGEPPAAGGAPPDPSPASPQ